MAKFGTGLIKSILMGIIILVLLMMVVSETSADVEHAANNVSLANATGGNDDVPSVYPLTSFMKKKGIVLLALMAGIALVAVTAFMPKGK